MSNYRIFHDEYSGYFVVGWTGSFWQQVSNYTPYAGVAKRHLRELA